MCVSSHLLHTVSSSFILVFFSYVVDHLAVVVVLFFLFEFYIFSDKSSVDR